MDRAFVSIVLVEDLWVFISMSFAWSARVSGSDELYLSVNFSPTISLVASGLFLEALLTIVTSCLHRPFRVRHFSFSTSLWVVTYPVVTEGDRVTCTGTDVKKF